jgi:ABC-type multidrug transport system fused ATPase/permease subunit
MIISLAVACLLATSAASIILPNFQGEILDSVIRGDHAEFEWDIKLYVLISVGLGFFGGIKSLAWSIVGSHLANDVRNKLFRAIIVQDVSFFDGTTTGELTSRLSSDTSAMTSPMQTVLSSTLSAALLLIGGFVMCLLTSWRLTVLAMTSIYPIVIITRAYAKWSSSINKASVGRAHVVALLLYVMLTRSALLCIPSIWAALGDASSVANQAISNIRTVRSHGTEELEVKKYTTATKEALDKSILDSWANGGTYSLTNYLDLATSVLLLWYGGGVAMGDHAGSLTVGKLITFQLYWGMMNASYTSLIFVLNSFTRASGAAQRVLTLMDSLPDIDLTQGLQLDHVRGDLEVKDLQFAYQMRPDNPVLKGVSLKIPANTVTALVGRSGSVFTRVHRLGCDSGSAGF